MACATHLLTSKEVVIKCIDLSSSDKDDVARADREIRVLQEVRGLPNVVEIYENVSNPPYNYIVMESLVGGNLLERLENRLFSEQDSKCAIKSVLTGLSNIHSKNVVHHNISLDNISFSTRDASDGLKLIGYSLAEFCLPHQTLTSSCGSPQYVAPEILCFKPHDQAVDMWSMGVVVYMMLSGKAPFDHEDAQTLFAIIKAGKYDMESSPWNSISDDAKDFVRHLLVVKPEERLTAKSALDHPWVSE